MCAISEAIMKNFKAFYSTILFILTLVTFGYGQTVKLPAGIEKIDSVEGITEYKLKNGLQILLIPDETSQNITVNIIYRVGSRHESYGETGMAHLLEHLLFRGTPRHPDIPGELTKRGASPNGTTWYDRTNYYETFVATDDNLAWALDLEADRMINSFVSREDLEKEFSVVRNEMESGENSPSRVLTYQVMSAAYQWHNYGKTTIGARSDVEGVKTENLQAFYRKYYQPDNATLVVAGKIDETKTLDLINQKFGDIPKPTRVLYDTWTREPAQDGERQVTLRRVGDIPQLMVGYHVPPASHPDYPVYQILAAILTAANEGILYKNLVETKKATNVSFSTFVNKEPTYSIYSAQLPKDADLNEVRDLMVNTIENFFKEPPSEEQVIRFRNSFLQSQETVFNNSAQLAMSMTTWVAVGDWRQIFLYRDRLSKITPKDIQRVAQTYLIESNRTVGIFVPTAEPLRANVPAVKADELAAMSKEIDRTKKADRGEYFDPSPLNIFQRTKNEQIGGINTALLKKDTRGDVVELQLNLNFGNEKSLMNRETAGIFAARMLNRGTKNKTRIQLRDEMTKIKSRIFVGGSATGLTVFITSDKVNLSDALRLAAEMIKEPGFSETEFEQLKIESISRLESQKSEPNSIASREMRRRFDKDYPKGHLFYPASIEEEISEIKNLKLEDVKKFYQDFYGASFGEMAIVGDFNEAETVKTVTELFGNWKSLAPYKRITRQFKEVPAFNEKIQIADKSNAVFSGRMNVKMQRDNPDYAAFMLGDFILGGGFLNSRLATRIRHKEGISYGVGSDFFAGSLDDAGQFSLYAIYAPENLSRIEIAFSEEINKVLKEGFTDEEIKDAKTGWLLGRQRSRGSDSRIASMLIDQMQEDRSFKWEDEFDKKIRSLTAEEVNAAMRKYLDLNKMSYIKAGDFEKTKTK